MKPRRRWSLYLCALIFYILLLDQSSAQTSRSGLIPTFRIQPHRDYPWSVLQIFYSPNAELVGFRSYEVNYTDVVSPQNSLTASYPFNEPHNPFTLYGLHPGHDYSVQILGISADSAMIPLHHQVVMTEPKSPEFENPGSLVATDSITLKGHKTAGALQDFFFVNYSQLDPPQKYKSLRVNDIVEQKSVELYLGNLNAGRNYNISVTAKRKNIESRPWHAIVTTTPLPPEALNAFDVFSSSLTLQWDAPQNSGVDKYNVMYEPMDLEGIGAIHLNDVDVTQVRLSENLYPGQRYRFTLKSLKGGQTSQPVSMETITRPLPPEMLTIEPDYKQRNFRITLKLTSSENSIADECILQILSETNPDLSAPNRTAPVNDNRCLFEVKLIPGSRYQFSGWSSSNGTYSTTFYNSTAIRPAFDANIFGIDMKFDESGSLTLGWIEHEPERTELQLLWQKVVGEGSQLHAIIEQSTDSFKQEQTGSPSTGVLKFDSLKPGVCYKLTMYTAMSGIISANQSIIHFRSPNPKTSLRLEDTTETSALVIVQLSQPSSVCQLHFAVQNNSGTVVTSNSYQLDQDSMEIHLKDLNPYTQYHGIATVRCGDNNADLCDSKESNLPLFRFETAQGQPGPVRNCSVIAEKPYAAIVSWLRPASPNGHISHYVISIYPTNTMESPWNVTEMASNSDHVIIYLRNLTGGLQYRFDVRAKTAAGLGQPAAAGQPFMGNIQVGQHEALTLELPVWAPPTPNGKPEILANTIRSTDFSVRFNLAIFSTRNGLLTKYAIIVSETDEDGIPSLSSNKTLTWSQVRSMKVWPSYVAVEKTLPQTKHMDSRISTEVLGVDEGCVDEINGQTIACNGPLRPSRHYRVKLRIFTRADLFSDSPYSELVMTEADPGVRARTVLSVILSLLIVLAIALILVLLLKKGSRLRMIMAGHAADCLAKLGLDSSAPTGLVPDLAHHRRSRSLRERTGADARLERISGPTVGHRFSLPPIPTILPGFDHEKSRPVRKVDFKEHVRLMSADSDFRFSEEYEDLKQVGRGQSCVAADLACNRNKNRFTNILPYDHSRVKLVPIDDEEGSDFINASYIPGNNSPREFIAAQGPLPSTRDDFWRMVWEQQCPAIINLTRCVEKGRDKCNKYWPENTDPITYGDIEVAMMNETHTAEWTMREFRLTHLEEAGTPERFIKHFHYISWPDFGVPDRPQSLVQFVRSFRTKVPPSKSCKPTVCHCSAGVGRSGTFVALDRLLQTILEEESVDIFAIVYQMRKERVWMVQTEKAKKELEQPSTNVNPVQPLLPTEPDQVDEKNEALVNDKPEADNQQTQSVTASLSSSQSNVTRSPPLDKTQRLTVTFSDKVKVFETSGHESCKGCKIERTPSLPSSSQDSTSTCESVSGQILFTSSHTPTPTALSQDATDGQDADTNESVQQQYICIHHALLCVLEGRENDDLTPPTYPVPVPPPTIAMSNQNNIQIPPPRIEVHQNPAFEDDEGIAESGV